MEPRRTTVVAADGQLGPPFPKDDHVDEEMLAEVLMLLEDEAPEAMLKACSLFLSGVPDRLVEIDAALVEGDFEKAAQASHSLRGSAGAFGARRLSTLGLRLEQDCREFDAGSAALALGEMRAEFALFRVIFEARLAKLTM